jgi:hypothetical protein
VNGIIHAAQVDAAPCELWNLHEPEIFLPLRAYDRIRFRKGLPWDAESIALARSALDLVDRVPLVSEAMSRQRELVRTVQQSIQELLGGGPALDPNSGSGSYPASTNPDFRGLDAGETDDSAAETAAAARSSSDTGLRQLRIIG